MSSRTQSRGTERSVVDNRDSRERITVNCGRRVGRTYRLAELAVAADAMAEQVLMLSSTLEGQQRLIRLVDELRAKAGKGPAQ